VLQEEDYMEAEIESSDTLMPNMTEQFGENLLQQKYRHKKQAISTNIE
jgi:hypothetical protein